MQCAVHLTKSEASSVVSRVNFTNILQAAFTRADPKSAKKTVKLSSFIVLLGTERVKAACRTLVKLTPICVALPFNRGTNFEEKGKKERANVGDRKTTTTTMTTTTTTLLLESEL